jgi:hypothetical protein
MQLQVGDLVRTKKRSDPSPWNDQLCEVVEVHGDFVRLKCNVFQSSGRDTQMWPKFDVDKLDKRNPYYDAVAIVDPGASNPSGVIRSMNRALDIVWWESREKGDGTDYLRKHPALRLMAYQLAYLLGLDPNMPLGEYDAALTECREKSTATQAAPVGEAVPA